MTVKEKIFVTLAIIGALFYSVEVMLTFMNRGFIAPLFVKSGLVVAFSYYAVSRIRKNSTATDTSSDSQ